MQLNRTIKNEVIRAVVAAMLEKVYDKGALEKMARDSLKAYYELMYATPDQRDAAHLLICAGLMGRMATVYPDDLITHMASYDLYKRAGGVWQTLGALMEKRNFKVQGRFPTYPLRHSVRLDDHYPMYFMQHIQQFSGNKAISESLEEKTVEFLRKLDDAAEGMIMVINVIEKAKKDDELIKALPEIANVVRHACDKYQKEGLTSRALPTAVDEARMRNFLGKIDPIELKLA